jgi:hypothetical protein
MTEPKEQQSLPGGPQTNPTVASKTSKDAQPDQVIDQEKAIADRVLDNLMPRLEELISNGLAALENRLKSGGQPAAQMTAPEPRGSIGKTSGPADPIGTVPRPDGGPDGSGARPARRTTLDWSSQQTDDARISVENWLTKLESALAEDKREQANSALHRLRVEISEEAVSHKYRNALLRLARDLEDQELNEENRRGPEIAKFRGALVEE